MFVLMSSAEASSSPVLYMAGDSIMADYKSKQFPQYGWGQSLKAFMKDPSCLRNFAKSGWSARRFRESGRWEKCIVSSLKKGDWVIVSFGHNDSNKRRNKEPKNDYSTISEYKAFLAGFVADARAKKANIAFATSIPHSAGFSEKDGVLTVDGGAKGLGPYVAAMRESAAELGVPLLDLNGYAAEAFPKMGMAKAKSLYMLVRPGEYANYPDGKQDPAHVRDAGAFFYAKAAVEMARNQGLPLAGLFKDPANVSFVPSVSPAKIVVDSSKVPEYAKWAREELQPALESYFPSIVRLLDGEKPVLPDGVCTVVLEHKLKCPAYCVGGKFCLSMDFVRQFPHEAKGACVHELAHVIQDYRPRPGRAQPYRGAPGWIVEGIADWVRWLNYEGEKGRKRAEGYALSDRAFDAGYRVSAVFLDWVAKKYNRDLIVKLNKISREGRYDEVGTWVELTGKRLEVLAGEWRDSMPRRPKPNGAIDVASYNIRRSGKPDVGKRDWKVRLPKIKEVIEKRGLELIGFQEVFPGQVADLKAQLKGWSCYGTGRFKNGRDEASPVFWKDERFVKLSAGQFWLSETPEVAGSKSWDSSFPRICTWVRLRDKTTGKEFCYFNCHLDHAGIAARRESVKLILRKIDEIAKGAPVLFGGDFNDEIVDDDLRERIRKKDFTRLTPKGPEHPISIVTGKLKDTRTISKTRPMGTYWTDNGYDEKHIKRIDYIFVSGGIDVLQYEVCCDRPDGIYPSDHEAVAVRIVLK